MPVGNAKLQNANCRSVICILQFSITSSICSPKTPSEILQHDFAAVASAHLGQHIIHGIADEASGAITKEPVGATGMPAPKMHLVTRVLDGAGLEADPRGGAWH